MIVQLAFPIWRTVVLGRHQTPGAYLVSIEGRGREPNKWARDIAAKVTCSQQEIELPLVDASGADLGFTKVYTTREFYERAATFGLYPCPSETGLALADQFDDQPKGDYRRIAMEAITGSAATWTSSRLPRRGRATLGLKRSVRMPPEWDPRPLGPRAPQTLALGLRPCT